MESKQNLIYMQERWIDFGQEVASVNNIGIWTLQEIKDWLAAWGTYVKKGGVRPGRPH